MSSNLGNAVPPQFCDCEALDCKARTLHLTLNIKYSTNIVPQHLLSLISREQHSSQQSTGQPTNHLPQVSILVTPPPIESPAIPLSTETPQSPKRGGAHQPQADLRVTPELIEIIIGLVSGSACPERLSTDQELEILKIFMCEVSHKKADHRTLSLIKAMTLSNYAHVLEATRDKLARHRKGENIRTVLTVLQKFNRSRPSDLVPDDLEAYRLVRNSELRIVERCGTDPAFHERIVRELGGEALRNHCVTQLRGQLVNYLAHWANHFRKTGRWKARFVSFPVEVVQAQEFFRLVVKKGG